MRSSVITLVAIFAACLTAAGCGGKSLSVKEGFIKKADRACATAERKIKALPKPKTLPGIVAYAKSNVSIIEDERRAIATLEQPKNDEARIKPFLAAFPSQTAKLTKLQRAAATNDISRLRQVIRELQSFSNPAADRFARSYGMKVCGSGA